MKQLYEDLWQTSLENPFPGLNTHAYFLQHNPGNVLIYNLEHDISEISKLGGIYYQYISHRHESEKSLSVLKSKFNSELCADSTEAPFLATPVDVTFSTREVHSSNIEITPTPGHTAGGICLFYQSPHGLNYLFTGGLFFLSHGHWHTLVFSSDGGNADKLAESLSTLRSLNPDVVLSSGSVGDTSFAEVSQADWHESIDTNIERLLGHG